MPSSTSNSKARAPDGPWCKIWLLALALASMALGGMELFWMHEGLSPTVTDDSALWAVYRAKVYGPVDKIVALLGSSRMQEDVSMPEVRRLLPDEQVVQLAIDGTDAVGSLRDLAADKRFAGIVVCEITEFGLEPANWESQDDFIADYHAKAHWYYLLDRQIEAWLQSHLRILAPEENLWQRTKDLMWHTAEPDPIYVTLADRSQDVHFERANLAAVLAERRRRTLAAYARDPPSDPAAWLSAALQVDRWAQQISARGGRVVFVRFPTAGVILRMDQRRYPRARYWDRFAATAHSPTLYFSDIPGLSEIPVPDDSHVGAVDKDQFTDRLVTALIARGLFSDHHG